MEFIKSIDKNFLINHTQFAWLECFFLFSYEKVKRQIKFEPKILQAFREISSYPVDINRSSVEQLAKIPGVSLSQALILERIRKIRDLDFIDIKKVGGNLSIARHFISSHGRILNCIALNHYYKIKDSQYELF
ncbi:MAG: hypothetical protein NZ853_06495 [Leptospiraceae bacterium]|nr:hypothetical protein [Leptospiraceae bacterium]MDW7976399.1 hypothetical protein [Leptospiraceae bacterium]